MLSHYRLFLSLTLILYLALLAWLSLIPPGYFIHSPVFFKGADKIVHGIIYSILSFLLFLLFIEVRPKSKLKNILYVFLLASAYGLLMEILQLAIRSVSRSFEAADIMANVLGALFGIALGLVLSPLIIRLTTVTKQAAD
jgi:VanZ family protein